MVHNSNGVLLKRVWIMDTLTELTEAQPQKRKRGRPPRQAAGLIESAARVFARDGFAAATIESIAAEANASPTTIYKIFGNKSDLFVEVMGDQLSQSVRKQAAMMRLGDPPLVGLYRLLRAHGEDCATVRTRGLVRAYVSEMRSNSQLADMVVKKVRATTITALTQLVGEAQRSGDLEQGDAFFIAHTVAAFAERFSLQVGLLVGDDTVPYYTADRLAVEAIAWTILRFGTEASKAHLVDLGAFLGSDIADWRKLEPAYTS
jgi:AcrR family transcriptional regulator